MGDMERMERPYARVWFERRFRRGSPRGSCGWERLRCRTLRSAEVWLEKPAGCNMEVNSGSEPEMNRIFARDMSGGAKNASAREQFFRLWPVFAACFAFAFVVVAGLLAVGLLVDKPLSILTRDPAGTAGTGAYTGVLSTTGVMLWAAATAICFFGAAQLRAGNSRATRFLFFGGVVSLLLTLDDALLLHEQVLPRLFIPEVITYLALMAAVGVYVVSFLRLILRTDYLLLAASVFFVGLMVALDQALPFTELGTFVEDGLKFAGIVFWLAYFSITASKMVGEEIRGSAVR